MSRKISEIKPLQKLKTALSRNKIKVITDDDADSNRSESMTPTDINKGI